MILVRLLLLLFLLSRAVAPVPPNGRHLFSLNGDDDAACSPTMPDPSSRDAQWIFLNAYFLAVLAMLRFFRVYTNFACAEKITVT